VTPVFWTEAALAHLAAIRDYIGQTSPVYAGRMIDCILARGTQLTHFPNSGRHVPERPDPLLREVLEGPYRVIYRVRPDRVEVLAIVHGRRADVGPLKSSE
jgi:plasmid stabilization system protein ParE